MPEEEPRPIPPEQKGIEEFSLESVSEEEARELIKRVEVHGDEYRGTILTGEILENQGLLPKHRIRVGEAIIWFSSSAYKLDRAGRIGVVAYVEKEGKIVARSFYQSNSQGIWRYLPEYHVTSEGKIMWYGKGYSEESITLPTVLQKALSEITKEGAPVLDAEEPDLIFAGTARKISPDVKITYRREVEATPKGLEGNFYPVFDPTKARQEKIPSEQVQFTNPEQVPDFSRPLASWTQKTTLYGDITIEVFASKDGHLRFMFCRDERGRAWIGGIEDDSEIQSVGLRRNWIKGGELTTPAYEYKDIGIDQTGGYGNDSDRRGPYVDMFENYLSKIPLIQEYLSTKKAELGEPKPVLPPGPPGGRPGAPAEAAAPSIPPEVPQPPSPPQPPEELRVPLEEEAVLAARAREEKKRVERAIRRELTPDEEKILYAKYLGERVNRLDQKTTELYEKYGRLTRSSKLKNFLTAVRGSAFVIAAGTGSRWVLKAIAPGFAWPGAVVGGVLGGLLGARRGYQAKERELLGAKGWHEEYQRIKGEAHDPEARDNALAFLENVLETPHNFKGNHSELLRILSFYRQETAQRIQETHPERVSQTEEATADIIKIGNERLKIDEQTIEAFFNNLGEKKDIAQVLVNNYRTGQETRGALRKAALKGALVGAGIGLGVGLAADALANYLTHLREIRANEVALQGSPTPESPTGQVWHYENEYTLWDVAPRPEELNAGLSQATDYGNGLRHAVLEGVRGGQLQLPTDVPQEQYQSFLHSLNFAQPLPEHANIPLGGHYDFTQRELQGFINMTLQQPEKYYNTILRADEAIASIRASLEQVAPAAGEITAEAARAATPPTPGIWPGIVTGAGAALGGEIAGGKMSGLAGLIKPARPEEAVPVAGAGRPAAPPEQPPEPQAPAPERRPPAEPTRPPEGPKPPETPPQAIEWESIGGDLDTLNQRANGALGELQAQSWENLSQAGRDNINGLFNFLKRATYSVAILRGKERLGTLLGYDESTKAFVTRPDKQGNLKIIQLTSPESMQNVTIKIEPPRKKR